VIKTHETVGIFGFGGNTKILREIIENTSLIKERFARA